MFKRKGEFKAFKKKVWLASPTMHGPEMEYVKEAYETNWMSTVGANINEVEKIAAAKAGVKYAVALAACTPALHLCVKLAGERLYGKPAISHGAVEGKRVFCSDMTFDATLNPVVYEGGIPVFIDTERDSWNMDPVALEKAFEMYPEVKLVISAELYGFSGDIKRIKEICEKHGALLIEDAAEAMGATWEGKQCGSYGDYSAISYNGNKIITGSAGGCFLTNNIEDANKVRKWSTQSRENAAWYQHEEVGYNYRMSNVIAGVVRGQYPYLEEHIAQKKAIYERYKEGLKDLPVQMNPFDASKCKPNYWLSALIIDKDAMCKQVRGETDVCYVPEAGKSCPTEILEAIASINAEGRPIWKPMHMQPMYRMHEFVTVDGTGRCRTNAYIAGGVEDVGADIFQRGVCLPKKHYYKSSACGSGITVVGVVFCICSAILVYGLSINSVSQRFMRSLEYMHPAGKGSADAVFVLGGGWGQREKAGIQLQKRYKTDVVVSGYNGEAQHMQKALLKGGVSIDKIVLESKATNTKDHVMYMLPIALEKGYKRIYLVTDAYHMPRSMMNFYEPFKNNGIEVVPYPCRYTVPKEHKVYYPEREWLPNPYSLEQSALAWHEYLGMFELWLSRLV